MPAHGMSHVQLPCEVHRSSDGGGTLPAPVHSSDPHLSHLCPISVAGCVLLPISHYPNHFYWTARYRPPCMFLTWLSKRFPTVTCHTHSLFVVLKWTFKSRIKFFGYICQRPYNCFCLSPSSKTWLQTSTLLPLSNVSISEHPYRPLK